MEIASLLAALREQGMRMTKVATLTAIDAPVPTCPDWRLRDLLLHTGGVHRWATTVVKEARTAAIDIDQPYDIVPELPADPELVDWFREGLVDLVDALESAPEGLDCWSFMPAPTPKAFWTRRQAHETTIHRIDTEAAAGASSGVEAELAADGIDELLTGFLPRNRRLRSDTERTVRIRTEDAGHEWVVTIGQERPRTTRAGEHSGPVDATVGGPAADVYLALWNRRSWDCLTVTGDTELLARWPESVQVRWS
jgi:uncharacterized protein (TIGR03083 family)